MTLCIAWKNSNNMMFASDSRFSNGDGGYVDIGVKIMQIPVTIINPIPVETGVVETIYKHNLGMCYCGDAVDALLIKETVSEVLDNLQYIPYYGDFSLCGICNVIKKFLDNTCRLLKEGMGKQREIEIEFLIGGYCPLELRLMAYKFEIIDHGERCETMFEEVLEDDTEIITMGSGKEIADQIIIDNGIEPGHELLKVLRDVCRDDSIESVGGYLQFGHFQDNNFKIKGVIDYRVLSNGQVESIFAYRGTILYDEDFQAEELNYHVTTEFIDPFRDELDQHYELDI